MATMEQAFADMQDSEVANNARFEQILAALNQHPNQPSTKIEVPLPPDVQPSLSKAWTVRLSKLGMSELQSAGRGSRVAG